MTVHSLKDNHSLLLIVVGSLAWLLPGGGHFALGQRRRAAVICVTVILTFLLGLYIGSVGVIDPAGARAWYAAQLMTTPAVMILGVHAYTQPPAGLRNTETITYGVYGRPGEIGQIYTSIAGLLNLLCIVNAIYMAHQIAVGEIRT